jgi:YceI-like protein
MHGGHRAPVCQSRAAGASIAAPRVPGPRRAPSPGFLRLCIAVSAEEGTYRLGPDGADLRVRTGRHGAAAKAGHDLLIEVTSWDATLEVGGRGEVDLELNADPTSLRVLDGKGGVQELTDEDKSYIGETIAKEILGEGPIRFRSTGGGSGGEGGRLRIAGDLEMAGATNSVSFELDVSEDGELSGGTRLKQSDWGIKPYSTLFGALKVNDEVELEIAASLSRAPQT